MRYHSLDIPNSFFEGVTKLKIVDFAGVNFVSGLPSSLGLLTGLQTLCLESCELNNVAIIAEMKQLVFLSFCDSNIVELPREIKALTRLKLLDLRGCGSLQLIPANILSNLSLLEELYMLDGFRGWEMEGNASLVELTSLSRLTTLEIEIRDDKLLPEDWFFNGLRNYKIYVGDWHDQYDANGTSRLLKLELKTSIGLMHRIQEFLRAGTEVLYVGEVKGIENLFYDCYRQLRFLSIRKCKTLKILFPFSSANCLPQLQELEVEDCGNMEAIVGEVCEDEVMEFAQLASLKLNSLPHLTGFCKTSRTVSFPNLTSLKVYSCNSLKYVFTTSMLKSLEQLKQLEISKCNLLEQIILVTKIEEEESIMNPIVFPQLDFLRLFSLPKMKRFSRGCPIEFSKLRELRINICNELKNFVSEFSDRSNNNESTDEYFFNELVTFHNLEMIHLELMENLRYLWHQQHFTDNDSFSKLKSLEIEHCSKLSVVFPSNAYRKFRSLESLHVSHCHGVEEIYEYKGAGIEETNVLREALALRQVYLWYLPSLKHILRNDINEDLRFENLQSVEVFSCPDLKYVFPVSIASGLIQLQNLEIENSGVEMIIAEAAKNDGSEGVTTRTFEWPEFKCLQVYGCDKLIMFVSSISNIVPSQDSLYFVEKVIPNVEVLKLDEHSLKAIQSDDHGFRVELLWKLKQVTLLSLKKESIPFLLGFFRRIYSFEKLIFRKGSLGEIFPLYDETTIGEERKYDHLRLKHLELDNVSNLKHIALKKDSQLNPILQCLQTLNVSSCDDLMNIAPSSASFRNLTSLKVKNCEKMTTLVSTSTAKSMIQLEELRVSGCKMMEQVIAIHNDGCTEEHDDYNVIIFNKLKCLELIHLPALNSFCSANYMFNFPMLEKLVIQQCNQMKIFCGGALTTPKLRREKLFGIGQQWEGNPMPQQ